jgi:hypothetical protein
MTEQNENVDSSATGLSEEQDMNEPKFSDEPQKSPPVGTPVISSINLDELDLPDAKGKDKKNSLPKEKLLKLKNLPLIQEDTRSDLAKWLVRGFVATIVGIFLIILIDKIFYYSASDTTKEKIKDQTGTKDLVSLILTAQSSLVGAAIGFYFGIRENK